MGRNPSLRVLIPSQSHSSEPKCWKEKKNEPISGHLTCWGKGEAFLSHCQNEVRGQSWFCFPHQLRWICGRRTSPGHEVWRDIDYFRISRPGTFPMACHGRHWPSLCKDLGIKIKLQAWGCGDPFMLKCRKKNICRRCPAGQWRQNWGKTQEWGVSSHSWLPLCSASGYVSAPLFTSQGGGQIWLYSLSLPGEEGNAPMHYI